MAERKDPMGIHSVKRDQVNLKKPAARQERYGVCVYLYVCVLCGGDNDWRPLSSGPTSP